MMPLKRPFLLPLAMLLLAAMLPLGGCGAGLITGAAASGGGSSSPPQRTPSLTFGAVLPLVPQPGLVRSVIVTDAAFAASTLVEVRLDALNVEVLQRDVGASTQGASTVVTFTVETGPIAMAVASTTQADIDAKLVVLVDGQPIGDPVDVVLARQPRASLVLPVGQQQSFLSPTGQEVAMVVEGLLATAPAEVQVLVSTRDPNGSIDDRLVRSATAIALGSTLTGLPTVTAFVPGNAFPGQVTLTVRDSIAGQSTPIENAFYRPAVSLALPSQGPATGGSLLRLVGTALVPYDFTVSPAVFDFERVSLTFSKGGRTLELPREDFRTAESTLDGLVFSMPPSPDGRPGQVDIVLRVGLQGAEALVVASQVFLYANPDPFYGPRGAVLAEMPVASVPIALDQAPSEDAAPDFAMLTEQGGVGFLQLLLAQQNGMFQPFRAPRQIGDHEVGAERVPRDLLTGDFDGDNVPDLFVVNEGAATAVHHVVLGQERPLPPLGSVYRVAAAAGSTRGRVADFDRDGLPDVLLIPGSNAAVGQLPQVLLARPAAIGQPGFAPPIDVLVRPFAFESVEVADFDDDGQLDLAFVSGTELKLDVVYGNGDGTFVAAQELDFTIPGYVADGQSPAVGLHACRDTPRQGLALVLAGTALGGPSPATIAVLSQQPSSGGGFAFVGPTIDSTYEAPVEPIGRSLVANLDGQPGQVSGPLELVVAMAGEPSIVSLGLLQFDGQRFEPLLGSIEGGVTGGAEVPVQIRSLAFATAFPATGQSEEKRAVFIVHEVDVDGVRERRLSTRLVAEQEAGIPVLLPPDAGAGMPFAIEGIVGGDFTDVSVAGNGSVRDLALATTSSASGSEAISIIENDGFGGFPGFGKSLEFPGLLPASMALVPSSSGRDALVFAGSDSRLGYWCLESFVPSNPSCQNETIALRTLLPPPWNSLALSNATRLSVIDADGDGVLDLVALLTFAVASPGEGDAVLALLRGKQQAAVGEFPFEVPTALTPVHGSASSFVVADFADMTPGLEVALTVPTGETSTSVDGNHVRFYRLISGVVPADDRYAFSAAPDGPAVLLAGSEPVQCAATDFDRDGLVDLLVACRGDSTLRLFRNTTAPAAGASLEVDVGAFVESLASPNALSPGLPTTLRLGDVNGDGNLDAVVWTEFVTSGGVRETSIATYLSAGTGELGDARFASRSRIGGFDARLAGDLGDWNRDGVPDLFLGWGPSPPPGPGVNLRVLFGGTR